LGIKETNKQLSDIEVTVNGDPTIGRVVVPSRCPTVGPRDTSNNPKCFVQGIGPCRGGPNECSGTLS